MPSFLTLFFEVYDQTGMQASIGTQATVKLELQAPSLPRRRKMPSRYFEGNAQPEHRSNVEDFYHQIYFEPVDTAANYIVEHKMITPCM